MYLDGYTYVAMYKLGRVLSMPWSAEEEGWARGKQLRTCLLAGQGPFRLSSMHPEAARVQLAALRALSVEERLRVAESLRSFAWELQASVIAQRHPELTPVEVLQRVREVFGRVDA